MNGPSERAVPAALGASRVARWYHLLAGLSLIAAFAVPAWEPRQVAGFHYHPKLLAVIHLITLGWISASILGWFYALAPTVLESRLDEGRGDRWAFWLYATGIAGMIAHFWIAETSGMIWSGGLILATFVWVAGRAWKGLARSRLAAAEQAYFHVAFANLLAAASFGLLVGLDKIYPFLPGFVLSKVFAHAHLAALGWAVLMVIAMGHRLLPMLLPARLPSSRGLRAGLWLFEGGLLGLVVALYLGSRWALAFALLVTAGLGAFLARVAGLLRNRLPAPAEGPRPDLPIGHLAGALVSLLVATVAGLAILAAPLASWRQAAIWIYGSFGLVGFLSQMIVGVSGRMSPLMAWSAHLGGRSLDRPSSPFRLVDRPVQVALLALWTFGVPLLAAGLAIDSLSLVRVASWCLLAAATFDLLHKLQMFRSAESIGKGREPAR